MSIERFHHVGAADLGAARILLSVRTGMCAASSTTMLSTLLSG